MSLSSALRNAIRVALASIGLGDELSDAVDVLASVTAGTGTASKALVLDSSGNVTMPDLGKISFGGVGNISWDTSDANANLLKIQLPAGGSVDVPVIMIGQSIEGIDQTIYNGAVDPIQCMLGVGAVATGPIRDFRKARGTATAPTVVTSGDDLGTIRAFACVAAGEWVESCRILMECTGTPATTRGPGVITISTATDAAPSVMTTAIVISAAQLVTLTKAAVTGDCKLNLTLTAGADGVGTTGEQLTSGGAAAETNWAAAGSLRAFKDVKNQRTDRQEVLSRLCAVPVYDFQYKKKQVDGPRLKTTGDTQTVYTGVMADECPEVMHHDGQILNPVNTFGLSLLAIQALNEQNAELRKEIEELKKKVA